MDTASAARREFLRRSVAFSAAFAGLHAALTGPRAWARLLEEAPTGKTNVGYGPLQRDREGLLNLPAGFTYTVIAKMGERMDDGLLTPGQPDGMACFATEDPRRVALVCNHELEAGWVARGPFGAGNELLSNLKPGVLYDDGEGVRPSLGGTTTLVYDLHARRRVSHVASLLGTNRNCAGGPTPWGSWLTCEEDDVREGTNHATQRHGYVFEVPASARSPVPPVPIRAMGRFMHEAVAVDPRTRIVYMTEDRVDGLLYRYIPTTPDRLHAGGRLQALALRDVPSARTGNLEGVVMTPGTTVPVRWIDLDDIEAPDDDLRHRGFAAGAAQFARGEGMWWAHEQAYFACTSGGVAQKGQLFRYRPSPAEATSSEMDNPGTLELFLEPNDGKVMEHPDNITASPWGDLIVCEDSAGEEVDPGNRLLGVTPDGGVYELARNIKSGSEFAGACFSPDGSTLFVNIQGEGLTLAIHGPWRGA